MTIIAPRPEGGRHLAVRIKRPADRRSSSRSATRALDVLELFGQVRRPLRAIEISRALDMHSSTTNQLLKTMVGSAHLVFDAQGKTYLPSPRLAEFSAWIVESYGADGRLRGLIEDIHELTGMVVTVTTPNDLFMQIVDAVIPSIVGDVNVPERGLQVSIFGSAIGSAYLAVLEEDDMRRLAHRARIGDEEIGQLIEIARQIRSDGYAFGPVAMDDTAWSIAMNLPAQGIRFPSVVGLVGPGKAVEGNRIELARIMRETIERWFGTD